MDALSSLRFFRDSPNDSAGVNRDSKEPLWIWASFRLGVACPFLGVYAREAEEDSAGRSVLDSPLDFTVLRVPRLTLKYAMSPLGKKHQQVCNCCSSLADSRYW